MWTTGVFQVLTHQISPKGEFSECCGLGSRKRPPLWGFVFLWSFGGTKKCMAMEDMGIYGVWIRDNIYIYRYTIIYIYRDTYIIAVYWCENKFSLRTFAFELWNIGWRDLVCGCVGSEICIFLDLQGLQVFYSSDVPPKSHVPTKAV